MTYVVSARLPFALVHTIGERRVVLVVPVELEHEVQNDFVDPGTGDRDRSDSAMGAQVDVFLDAEGKQNCKITEVRSKSTSKTRTPVKQRQIINKTCPSSKTLR